MTFRFESIFRVKLVKMIGYLDAVSRSSTPDSEQVEIAACNVISSRPTRAARIGLEPLHLLCLR